MQQSDRRMTERDFKLFGITKFTPQEVQETGADLSEVRVETMIMMQRYRVALGRAVVLLPGGMTTGNHRAKEHPLGLAVDSGFIEQDGKVDVSLVFRSALTAGARGIGIYWNGHAYSVHLDLRQEYSFWSAWKAHRETEWKYRPLIIDPAVWERGVIK